MTQKHAPTPWNYEFSSKWKTAIKDNRGYELFKIGGDEKERALAKDIVKAANMHTELIEALKRHHNIAKTDLETYVKLDDGTFISLDSAEGYAESGFQEKVESLLLKATKEG